MIYAYYQKKIQLSQSTKLNQEIRDRTGTIRFFLKLVSLYAPKYSLFEVLKQANTISNELYLYFSHLHLGKTDGSDVGSNVGIIVGALGANVGVMIGRLVVGMLVGLSVGILVGILGLIEGNIVGRLLIVGLFEGAVVGTISTGQGTFSLMDGYWDEHWHWPSVTYTVYVKYSNVRA